MKIKLILPLLIISLTKVSISSSMSETPNELLMRGVNAQNLSLVKKALNDGADVNIQDEFGGTHLQTAADKKNYDIIKLLLDSGADVNKKHAGITQAHKGNTALHFTARSRAPLEVVKLLIDAHADVNAQNRYGITPLLSYLHNATPTADLNTIQLFLNAGTDLTLKSKSSNEGPLEYVTTFKYSKHIANRKQVVKLLEEWQEKHKQTIRKEAGEYLIPDLCDITAEYVVGPI